MLERATRLHDGSLVFKDKNGDARYEDGRSVSEEDAATIVWRDGSPTYEEQRDNAEGIQQTRDKIEEYREYETRVGEIQHELEEHKDDLTEEDVRGMQKELVEGAPEEIKAELRPADVTEATIAPQSSLNVSVPKF